MSFCGVRHGGGQSYRFERRWEREAGLHGREWQREDGESNLTWYRKLGGNMEWDRLTRAGEIAAINNCSKILTSADGEYRLNSAEALKAFSQLTLYTTAEACPMVCPQLSDCLGQRANVCSARLRFAGLDFQNTSLHRASRL